MYALTALLHLASEDRAAIAMRFRSRLPFLQAFLSHLSAAVRALAAKLLGVAASGLDSPAAAELVREITANLPPAPAPAPAAAPVPAVSGLGGKGTVKFEAAHGNTLAAGFVCAAVREGVEVAACVEALVAALGNRDAHLATAAAAALGYIQFSVPLPIALGGVYKLPEAHAPKSAAGVVRICRQKASSDLCVPTNFVVQSPSYCTL